MLSLGLVAGAALASGCFAPAIALAPLAVQAAEGVGMGATYLASNAVADTGDPGDDPVDRRERCGELEDAPPNVIELRQTGGNDALQWRELRVDNAGQNPRWVVGDASNRDAGWHPAENLREMSFRPPLSPSFKPGKSTYLVYAPAAPETTIEDDQLTNMTGEFGSGSGTFQWKGHSYQYAMVERLPCFPPPVATK
ncbi:MAG TPA: hypothetical protein VKS22_15265 [Candidatus Binataceae bacterium]|nr:hypothetical protein [Candidatus Binataceae bacterium]